MSDANGGPKKGSGPALALLMILGPAVATLVWMIWFFYWAVQK
jgi:hypothetical protein